MKLKTSMLGRINSNTCSRLIILSTTSQALKLITKVRITSIAKDALLLSIKPKPPTKRLLKLHNIRNKVL